MTIESVEADDLTVADPYVIGSPPDNLAGWVQIANALRVASATPKYFLGTNANNCVWINSTKLVGTVFYARVTLDVYGSESQGVVVSSLAGAGYQLLVNSTLGARLFAMTTGGVLGGQKGSTVATAANPGEVVEIEFRVGDPAPGSVRLICKVNGVTRIDFNEVNANPDWYGGGVVRGSGRMRAIEVEYTAAQTLTIGTPLVPGVSRTDTCTGFADGAATVSFSGVSVGVTIASGSLTYTVPTLADDVAWPKLPATGQTITLTQSALTATASASVSMPVGFNVVRDGAAAPANFSGLVSDDGTYLQPAFVAAGNPLTTDDTALHVTSGEYLVRQNGAVGALTATLPRTDALWVYRGIVGKYYLHNVTLVAADVPPIVTPSLTPRFRSLLRVSGSSLTVDGVAHANGRPLSLSPYGGLQSALNGAWLAQSASAAAGSLVLDGVTIAPPAALYRAPSGRLTTTPNGRPVAVVRS